MEHNWTNCDPKFPSVTVKYTDKRKFEEIIKKNKEFYPQIYSKAKVEQMTTEIENWKSNNEELKVEMRKKNAEFEAKFEKMTIETDKMKIEMDKVKKNCEDLQAKIDQMEQLTSAKSSDLKES